ncbi:hypothetical protein P171DRAFT_428910 [Karstenula rhodostoma CBS 690.94]|uniref:Uncharacterized protein n=1 Tax=Karstenula rhodostoma CBS 690.94 TaxID=1392251 RepID=A0A9P4UH52_9PLEO|nr:hypothetical protein P171DRAFT_428910 [Karstenula rhodostoma CBS 690.94]
MVYAALAVAGATSLQNPINAQLFPRWNTRLKTIDSGTMCLGAGIKAISIELMPPRLKTADETDVAGVRQDE